MYMSNLVLFFFFFFACYQTIKMTNYMCVLASKMSFSSKLKRPKFENHYFLSRIDYLEIGGLQFLNT